LAFVQESGINAIQLFVISGTHSQEARALFQSGTCNCESPTTEVFSTLPTQEAIDNKGDDDKALPGHWSFASKSVKGRVSINQALQQAFMMTLNGGHRGT
jgi:hypothetical protein